MKHVKVVIIGAGPAGMGAALGLSKRGVDSVLLIERSDEPGGFPARYKKQSRSVPTFVLWTEGRVVHGEEFAARLRDKLANSTVEVLLNSQVIEIESRENRLTLVNVTDGKTSVTADAFVLACGAREKTLAERGWLTGSRPAGVYFTNHLLDFRNWDELPILKQPVIVGGDLIAYSAAAHLKAGGSSESVMIDTQPRPACNIFQRFYFRKWCRPEYRGSVRSAAIGGTRSVENVRPADGSRIACDCVVVSGDLVPNSEMALLGGLDVELPSRIPKTDKSHELSVPGWFAAGNVLGGFHGAQWCYFNGLRVANRVARYLAQA
ncbi:MAG: FAD-dependent oxidoreductase [bacterium]